MDYNKFLQEYKDRVTTGDVVTLEPLLSLFQLSGNPLSLAGREPMKPLFRLQRPKRMTFLAGRQVSKSYTIAELAILLSGFNKDFSSVIVEPYFDQKKRFTRQILSPLLRDCAVQSMIIDKNQIDPMDIKQMKAGGQIILVNGVKTASNARGASGISFVTIDESARGDTGIITIDGNDNQEVKQIKDIKKGDVVLSFSSERRITKAVVKKDSSFHGIRAVYRLTTSTGGVLYCTLDHSLETNIGRRRLSEVVEYECSQRDSEGGSQRDSAVSYIGESVGGQVYTDGVQRGREAVLASEYKTDGIVTAVQPIIRARLPKTVHRENQRIRGLLSRIKPEKTWSVAVRTLAAISRSEESEKCLEVIEDAETGTCTICGGTGKATDSNCMKNGFEDVIYTGEHGEFFYDPIVSIEYVGEDSVYDIEVVGTHNYILANGMCSYNCQDVLNSLVPVFEAVADAKPETGFRLYSGTAKRSDDTLALKFNESSQGHWCMKCYCGKYNIASIDEQLMQMLKPQGLSCAFCGKLLNPVEGSFVHKFPSRIYTHIGYHLPQPIMGFHSRENAWTELIYKLHKLDRTLFLNEVLGCFSDESARMLTKDDVIASRNGVRSIQQALQVASSYDLLVMGVDWGGGGGGDSATGVCVLGKQSITDKFDCIFMTRIPQGYKPEEECKLIGQLASDFGVHYIAHDYTGAGFVREALFLTACPEWTGRMYPISYSYRPTSDLISYSSSGSRGSYVVDKTKSLLLTINCIKYKALSLPWFDPKNDESPQYDFLAIIEHVTRVGDSESGEAQNTVQKASQVYLLDKLAGKKDDAAQAVNIALVAMCNTLNYYPVFTIDSRFEITPDVYRMLWNDDSPNPI